MLKGRKKFGRSQLLNGLFQERLHCQSSTTNARHVTTSRVVVAVEEEEDVKGRLHCERVCDIEAMRDVAHESKQWEFENLDPS